MVLLTLAEEDAGKLAREFGLTRKALDTEIQALRGGDNVNSAGAKGQRVALK